MDFAVLFSTFVCPMLAAIVSIVTFHLNVFFLIFSLKSEGDNRAPKRI